MSAGGSRRRALVLGGGLAAVVVVAVGALVLWRALADRTFASAPYSDTVRVGEEPTVRLSNDRGAVEITGDQERDSVSIEARRYARGSDVAEAREAASGLPVDITREGSTFTLQTGGGDSTGVDYSLSVPSGSSVEVESGAGPVSVAGVSRAEVRSQTGDISLEEIRGPVSVESYSGDVGARTVSTDAGRALFEVGSGDLELEDIVVGTLEATVETGEVRLLGRFGGSGSISVETGDIVVDAPRQATQGLSLDAQVGRVQRDAGDEE